MTIENMEEINSIFYHDRINSDIETTKDKFKWQAIYPANRKLNFIINKIEGIKKYYIKINNGGTIPPEFRNYV